MNNITISSYSNYPKQGEMLQEILDKNNEYQKYKRILQKDNITETLLNSIPLNEERFNEISKQMTKNKLCQLDNYCIFLASKYFETIEDHINLIHVCKRLRCNIDKFHFNPLSLTKKNKIFLSKYPNIVYL